jgi:hypothetical protein
MNGWAVRLEAADATYAAALRTVPQLLALVDEHALWVRGPTLDEPLELRLRSLPGAQRFDVDAANRLTRIGQRIPSGTLPAGDWRPLRDWFAVELPGAALAGVTDERMPLELVRGGKPAEPTLLRLELNAWRDYALQAPQVRLECWTFAVSQSGSVLVRGTPLPPLPGERFVESAGVAVPAGWTWAPAVEASVVRDVFGLGAGELALWSTDGSWERVRTEDFVKATRSAVRLSAQG